MVRSDNRPFNKIRKLKITRNYIKFAEGSCLIELGNTKVVCTATVEEKVPPFLRDTGKGWITAEYGMLPRSCKIRIEREATRGRASSRTYEIQRLIGRSLRAVVDLTKLGERTIWIDCDVIQADGGTRTAAITGSFIALYDALSRLKRETKIGEIPIKDFVAATSVGIIEGTPALDLTYEEDSKAEVDMNVVMTGGFRLIEIQGTAERQSFSTKELNKLITLAKSGIKKLIQTQNKILKCSL